MTETESLKTPVTLPLVVRAGSAASVVDQNPAEKFQEPVADSGGRDVD